MTRVPRRRARVAAWIVILAAAALQAYARRYSMTPDGISYLDMSDAVVAGHWSGLVDAYWSPLYPALIGLARLIIRPSPAGEFAAVHALNFVLFALTIPAFEFFLDALIDRARDWRRSPFHSRWGIIGAYVVFGSLSLTMTPVELPTPDLIVSSVLLVAFGATLRLQDGRAPRRYAVMLGVALGVATLAKSFFVPWSIIYLVVLAFALRRQAGARTTGIAAAAWGAIAVPWCLAVSVHAGKPTFGETGRLTYAWFVNGQEPPALRGMPSATETPSTGALLPGVGVTGDAPGTNPVWRDPVRWSGGLQPHFDVRAQLETSRDLLFYYIRSLSPLIFIVLLAVMVATPEARALAWRRGWVIWVPTLVAMAAYGLIVVTTRYLVPFLVAGLLLLAAALPWPRRIAPRGALLGVLLPLVLLAVTPNSPQMLSLMSCIVMALILAYVLRHRPVAARLILVPLGAFVTRLVLSPVVPTVTRVGAALLVIGFWRLATDAERGSDARTFARITGLTATAAIGFLIAGRAAIRMYDDAQVLSQTNTSAVMAQHLAMLGISPESRVAVIGSPYDAYWARTGRLRIVAVVPPPIVQAFWALPATRRDSLLAELRSRGAAYAISTSSPLQAANDPSWLPVPPGGWVRALGANPGMAR